MKEKGKGLFDITGDDDVIAGDEISRGKLKMLMDSIPGGVIQFYYNQNEFDFIYGSDGYFKLIGGDRREYYKKFEREMVFEGMEERDQKRIEKAIRRSMLEGGHIEEEVRIHTLDTHQLKWVAARGSVMHTKDNRIYVQMVFSDITNLKKTQAALEQEKEKLKILASLAADSFFDYLIDEDELRCYRSGNELKKESFILQEFMKIINEDVVVHKEDVPKLQKLLEDVKERRKKEFTIECRIYLSPKVFQYYQIAGCHMDGEKNGHGYIIGKITNIHKQKLEEFKLREESRKDSMTQIYHRAEALKEMSDYLQKHRDKNIRSVYLVDIDAFHEINDSLGRIFGDEILIYISKQLKQLFADNAVIGRYGGDSFLIFDYGENDESTVSKKSGQILNIVRSTYVGKIPGKLTASVGISLYPVDGIRQKELLEHAQLALYAAKDSGKDCCKFYVNSHEQKYAKRIKGEKENRKKIGHQLEKASKDDKFYHGLLEFALDIMEDTKDAQSALQLLMKKVGENFHLGRIFVTDSSNHSCSYTVRYEWCANGIPPRLHQTNKIHVEDWKKFVRSFDENGFVICNDTRKQQMVENLQKQVTARRVGSYIHCGIFDMGMLQGTIGFEIYNRYHKWTDGEIRTIKIIVKIITQYLLKLVVLDDAEKIVKKLTNFDEVTGLYKQEIFLEKGKEILKKAHRGKKYAVVSMDIRDFKYINETFGYQVGDKVLSTIGEVYQKIGDSICVGTRIVADRFCFLITLKQSDMPQSVMSAVNAWNKKIYHTILDMNPNLEISFNCGVFILEDNKMDFETAMDNANTARKKAKTVSNKKCVLFNEEMRREILKKIEIVTQMENALFSNEFVVELQPKIYLKSKKIVGAEALVRWRRADGSIVRPDEFIPVFEDNGFVVRMDFYVYEKVFRYIRKQIDQGLSIVPISLNVSRVHLRKNDFAKKVKELVDIYQVPCELLEFEITESAFLDQGEKARRVLEELREYGFIVSMDDFGSGYSSLSQLKDLSIDVLKMDKGFLKEKIGKNDGIVLANVIRMAKEMNMTVLCEGVENQEQVEFLEKIHCDIVQGYYFSKSVPFERFSEMLEQNE